MVQNTYIKPISTRHDPKTHAVVSASAPTHADCRSVGRVRTSLAPDVVVTRRRPTMEAPRTVDEVYGNFNARRAGLIKALTSGACVDVDARVVGVGVAKMMMRGCATTDFVMINDAF